MYSGTAANPTAKAFIAANQISGNSYTFTDSGFFRFNIRRNDYATGHIVAQEDLPEMAGAIHYYTGGVL